MGRGNTSSMGSFEHIALFDPCNEVIMKGFILYFKSRIYENKEEYVTLYQQENKASKT